MKPIAIILLYIVGLISTSAQDPFEESPSQLSNFSASGFGRVFYEPDSYDLTFGVVTNHADIQVCKETHLAAIEKVKAYLDANKEKIISLKQNAARLETIYPNYKEERFLRFTTSYTIRVKEATSLLSYQEGLISAGATDIYGIDMFSDSLPSLTDQARKEAIKDAKSKAELAANELGWKLRGATNIRFEERTQDPFAERQTSANFGSRAAAFDTSKRQDLTTYISAGVTITFAFETKKTVEHDGSGQPATRPESK